MPPVPEHAAPDWIGTVLSDNGIRTASALVAATQAPDKQGAAVTDSFPERAKRQALSLAAVVQLYANYPLIQNWLSTEPYFPPDKEQTDGLGLSGDAAPIVTSVKAA